MDGKFSQGVEATGKYGMCSRQWYPRELATVIGPTKWSHEKNNWAGRSQVWNSVSARKLTTGSPIASTLSNVICTHNVNSCERLTVNLCDMKEM